ncbi:MAG: hypothetical protein ACYTEX_10985 [Planctomycetota bacterium]|jgi:hypothetical protein
MKKAKIAAVIRQYIDDLKAGRCAGFWDAGHKPRKAECDGRIALLESILRELGLFEAESGDG